MLTTRTDHELIELLRQDDERAFDELYNRYWDNVYGIAYKRLHSREATEELVQDLFTSLWASRKTLRVHTSVAAYLAASIKYLVINHLQKEIVRRTYAQTYRGIRLNQDDSTTETVLLHDLQGTIEREVSRLPEKCRMVFELSRYQEHSMKEIAARLNISEKTVENHIGKALKMLKMSLRDFVTGLLILALLQT